MSGRPAGWLASQVSICGKTFNIVIFLDTINILNVKLCIMVVFIELYQFIPLAGGHYCISSSQQCQTVLTENLYSYPIKFKLCVMVYYMVCLAPLHIPAAFVTWQ